MSEFEREITPIKIGDQVWCADYDEDWRVDCWVNGRKVMALTDNGDRAVCAGGPEGFSHRVFGLRHDGERVRTLWEEAPPPNRPSPID